MMEMRKKIIDSKDAAKECQNCAYGLLLGDEKKIFCEKSGIRNMDSTCKKFKYSPLCRVPRRQPTLASFSEEDFAL